MRRIIDTNVAGDSDEALAIGVAQSGDQSHVRDKIELGQADQFLVRHGALEPEKSMVNRILAQAFEMLEQPFSIVWTQRTDMNRPAVTQNLLDIIVSDIGD